MCGIAGYLSTEPDRSTRPDVVEAMCAAMVHRGPDDQGIYTDNLVALGMRRLSIIDLSTGHQPISNEKKNVWVVLNGEIYNYRELAAWLRNRGHEFRTSSDTEVIVHLYEEMGDECIQRLRGMFAFALWDAEECRLLVARDRLGVKPLYYFWDQKHFVFGSELKALLVHPAVKPALNPAAVLYYLRYSYIPDPLSIFQGVSKLAPASYLIVTPKGIETRPYWSGAVPYEPRTFAKSEEDVCFELEETLRESVRLRLVSDVPLGAFLSGGIDSSLVVALMAQEMNRAVSTFSIGFEEAEYNELPYARLVANHVGADHHELIVKAESCALIERIIEHCDEPFGDPSAIPMYHLSGLASQHVTVALSGDGGDELFAGYERYAVDLRRQKYGDLPLVLRQGLGHISQSLPPGIPGKAYLRNISLNNECRYFDNTSYFPPHVLQTVVSEEFYRSVKNDADAEAIMAKHFGDVEGQPWLSQLQYVDTKTYLPADVMTKVDRMSMAHSLEAREPLLDHELVEYLARLPVKLKSQNGVTKYILRQVAKKYLPEAILTRRKQGFGVPLEYWFKDDLREYIQETLFEGRMAARGIFNMETVQELVERYERGRKELASNIWILLVFETWCRLYLDRPFAAPSLDRIGAHA